MIQSFIQWCKKFAPYLGITALFFLLVLIVVFLFNYYSPNSAALVNQLNPFYLLLRWDTLHYLEILTKGYQDASAFFPLYPLLIGAVSLFFPLIFSGYFISFISLAVALYFLSQLLKEDGRQDIKDRVIILLLAFPSAMFFALIYTESLFLALTIAFFYYLHKRSWFTAVCIGFFAALTRNVGIFLWPVYLVAFIMAFRDLGIKTLGRQLAMYFKKKELWYSLVIPAGLIAYCLYTYVRFDDFFGFISAQSKWSQWKSFMWPGATLYQFYKLFFVVPISETGLYNFMRIVVIEGGSFFILLATTIYWFAKRHWTYAVFCLFNTLLFSCMFPMISVNRYVVVIFPIFIALAELTKKVNWLFFTIMAFFFILFIFNVYLFAMGGWVG